MANIIDSYSEINKDGFTSVALGGSQNWGLGQSFMGNGSVIGSAKFYLLRLGTPTGNATAKIYAHSGTFGTSSLPTGAALATSDAFDVSTIGTVSFALYALNFTGGNQIPLADVTPFVVTFEFNATGDGSNKIEVGLDSSSPTHGGNYVAENSASVWSATSSWDNCFYVYDNGGASSPVSFIKAPTVMVMR